MHETRQKRSRIFVAYDLVRSDAAAIEVRGFSAKVDSIGWTEPLTLAAFRSVAVKLLQLCPVVVQTN